MSSIFRSPSSTSTSGSSPSNAFKRTFRTSFSASTSSKPPPSEVSIPDSEGVIAFLRVQVVGCRDLPAADANGKSDPYVTIYFGDKKYKTPVIKKNLNPKWTTDATFDLPLTATNLKARGGLVDLVVWDKDIIGKDYLAEVSLKPSQWFKNRDDQGRSYAFDDARNLPLSYLLVNAKPRRFLTKNKPAPDAPQATVILKIGLFATGDGQSATQSDYYETVFREIQTISNQADRVSAAPPAQALTNIPTSGDLSRSTTLRVSSPTPSRGSPKPLPATPKKGQFQIKWDDVHIDYDFNSKKSIAGIILLEVQEVKDLPKIKNWTRSEWNMDPYIVVKHRDDLYRTKVLRHDLNPAFNDKFILYIHRSKPTTAPENLTHYTSTLPDSSSSIVVLNVLDWEQFSSKNRVIGSVEVDLKSVFDDAPRPDEETGLFSVEAMRLQKFQDLKLDLGPGLKNKEKWDKGTTSPIITIRAKYEPNAAMRQRFWRNNLIKYDKDHTGQLSRAEIVAALDVTGLDDVTQEKINKFFVDSGKNPDGSDELTIEEAMICLEREYGVKKQVKEDVEEAEVEAATLAADTTVADMSLTEFSGKPPTSPIEEEDESEDAASPTPPPLRPARSSMFGHSRDSMHELDVQLKGLFMSNPQVQFEEDDEDHGDPKVPANALPSILTEFSRLYDIDLLEQEEAEKLKELVEGMADVLIGPDFLMGFIAKITGVQEDEALPELDTTEAEGDEDVNASPQSPRSPRSPDADDEAELDFRGRSTSPHSTTPSTPVHQRSRAASRDSVVSAVRASTEVPETPKQASVFDVRQRSTPLGAGAPPSSWSAKPVPAAKRRRSSVGSVGSKAGSDTESSQVATFRDRDRSSSAASSPTRTGFAFPANNRDGRDGNTSGSASSPDEHPANGVPRPASRTGSVGGFHSLRFPGSGSRNASVTAFDRPASPDRMRREQANNPNTSLESSQYTTFTEGFDDDDDNGPNFNRYSSEDQTSLYSIETPNTTDKIDELERNLDETTKKLKDVQRTLEEKMASHEVEMEELLAQKDDLEVELASSRKDEKELRLKDSNAAKQLSALESEVSRLQKELEASKSSYQSLQKMYQEQCNEAERHRDALRRKDMELKDSEKYAAIIAADVEKWQSAAEQAQQLADALNKELDTARETISVLDRQKQENLSLKETIDRLRFELDELRNSSTGVGSAVASRTGTLVPSLALEMQNRLREESVTPEDSEADTSMESEHPEDDYVETVITRRKIGKKGKSPSESAIKVHEIFKDYQDASAQHIQDDFVNHASIQTILEVVPVLAEAEAGPSTAGPSHTTVVPQEAPPSYSKLLEDEERERIGREEIEKWHAGMKGSGSLPTEISLDTVEEWKRVKEEIGFTCTAIDEIIDKAEVTGPRKEKAKAGPGGVESITKWTFVGLFGAFCLLSFVAGAGVTTFFRARATPTRIDSRFWEVVNDWTRIGGFPDLLHRPPTMPWSTIKNFQNQLRPNWEPI